MEPTKIPEQNGGLFGTAAGGESQLRSWVSKRLELQLSKGQALPQDLAIITRSFPTSSGELPGGEVVYGDL